ncbi:hypothetical protein BD413DRAFT_538699, partial [Trametes elegans]
MPPKRGLDDVDATYTATMALNPIPARGRRRFQHDLQNAIRSVEQGVEVQGFRLSNVSSGEEDGSFDCAISRNDGHIDFTLTLLVSDSSEYPSDHTFFCSSQQKLPETVASIIDTVYEDGPVSIQSLLLGLLERVAKRMTACPRQEADTEMHSGVDETGESNEDEDDEDDAYDMDEYDMDDLAVFGGRTGDQTLDASLLQRDFNEIVVHGYQPGFIRFGVDDFALSVSLPAKFLAEMIAPRALVAWDKRLLSGSRHLTLLVSGLRGVYPVVQSDGTLTQTAIAHSAALQFRVGLSAEYKPTKEDTVELLRRFGLKEEHAVQPNAQSEETEEIPLRDDTDDDPEPPLDEFEADNDLELEYPLSTEADRTQGFLPFSLSSSLESLLNGHFLAIMQLRLQHGLGWASAEVLRWEIENTQRSAAEILREKGEVIRQADNFNQQLAETYRLPADCLLERKPRDPVNLPLAAFSYLFRRLALCPRYCLVCHQQLDEDIGALKPFVCSSTLCTYQYYNLNRGPSLEYEICSNPTVVDLLVSLAYIAAAEGALEAPLPIGMGLRVTCRLKPTTAADGLHDFDQLNIAEMRGAIRDLIDNLPPIIALKRHLEQPRKPGHAKPRLQDVDRSIPDAAWLVLRWCVASCTAYLEELQSDDEKVKNMGTCCNQAFATGCALTTAPRGDPTWRQFRFSVGAPDAEAKFRRAVQQAQQENSNARQFPSLYAFHGSGVKNWHSIIRHGLWFKTVTNGRAYGHGVYFAKDGNVSLGTYAAGATSCWRNSAVKASACVALAEIVNLPEKFVSTNPFFVVSQTEWIVCRYLMVRGPVLNQDTTTARSAVPVPLQRSIQGQIQEELHVEEDIPFVPLDPRHPLTLSQKLIRIPEPSHALDKLVAALSEEYVPAEYDEEDRRFLSGGVHDEGSSLTSGEGKTVHGSSDTVDDWKHDRVWVDQCVEHLMPPPAESSPMASSALQRELRAMLKEQKLAKSLRELGWYLSEELMGDNLYQWIIEVHSFESTLPIARDLEAKHINSLVFEIRFPPTFPHSPPFFRILKPRFLPFIQGGGGHVTGGGSMCMDLLTADGWLPSY